MVLAIILIVLTVLCILLLLPLRIKGSFGDGKWSVTVYYAFVRVLHKESPPPKPPAETPPLPDPEQHAPPPDTGHIFQTEPEPQPEPKPEPKPEPVTQESAVTETPAELPAEPPNEEKPEKPKKKNFIRRYIDRLKPHSLHDIMGLVSDGCSALSPALRFFTRHLHFRHMKLYLAVGTDDAAKTAKLYGGISAGAYNLLGALQCWFDIESDEMRILADFFSEKITFRASGELRCSPAALIITALTLGIRFLRRTIRRFRKEDQEAKRYEQESAPLPQT